MKKIYKFFSYLTLPIAIWVLLAFWICAKFDEDHCCAGVTFRQLIKEYIEV